MTQPLDLNLATRPFQNNTLPWAGLIAGALLFLGFTIWNVGTYRDHVRKLAEARDQETSIASQLEDLARREDEAFQFIRTYDINGLRPQVDKANEVIGWKAFSWTRLFNRMETVQPWNVYMRSIQPLLRDGREDRSAFFHDNTKSVMVAVEGVAKDLNALLDFESRLFLDPHFAQAEPEEYEEQGQDIFFTLRFLYYPLGKPGSEDDVIAAANPGAGTDGAAVEADGEPPEAGPAEGQAEGDDEGGLAERELPRIQRPGAAPVTEAPAPARNDEDHRSEARRSSEDHRSEEDDR